VDKQAVGLLEQKKQLAHVEGRVQITQEGLSQLRQSGIRVSLYPNAGNSEHPPVSAEHSIWNKDQIVFIPLVILISLTLILGMLSMIRGPSFVVFTLALLMLLVTGIYIWRALHRVPEYERLVIFRLGKCEGVRGPGLVILMPGFDKIAKADLRVQHLEVPHEQCITQDNVVIDVDFVLYWQVQQAEWSITRIANPEESLRLLATALLRAVIAHFPFSEVQTQRERINDMLRQKIDDISTAWGVYVTTVEIREIKPPPEIITSMQLQAAAEWKRQATVTEAEGYREAQMKKAEGDAAALRKIYEVATKIDDKTLRLRYFAMLGELGSSASTKFVLPVELIDLVRPFAGKLKLDDVIHPHSLPSGVPSDHH
jgi:regulator of protease activity HflC (stomatin/prohibitin superfamily)